MKNLNSFQSVQRAIEDEYRRQVEAVERGETIVQETRRFDQQTGKTSAMRRKENANDYRYFPDPDLAPIVTGEDTLAAWRAGAARAARPAQGALHGRLWPDRLRRRAAGERKGPGRVLRGRLRAAPPPPKPWPT